MNKDYPFDELPFEYSFYVPHQEANEDTIRKEVEERNSMAIASGSSKLYAFLDHNHAWEIARIR